MTSWCKFPSIGLLHFGHMRVRKVWWVHHFKPLYLLNYWSYEKSPNIKVIEEIKMSNSCVENFFIWSFHHGEISPWTLVLDAHKVFAELPGRLARPWPDSWAKMPCEVQTLINHNSLNFDPMGEFLLWICSWEYDLSIWPCGILIWVFNFKWTSSKVRYPKWQNLPFLVNLIFYFRQLYTFLDFWWISWHFLIKSLPMNIFDMMNMNLTSKSQELTFSLHSWLFPNLINFQSTDQLEFFWIESMANISSLDTWNHVKNLENQFGLKSCQFTAFIKNPNFGPFC